MKVKHILSTKGLGVVVIGAHQTIQEALTLLSEHNIGALVVVDASRQPVGILSERDIVRGAVRDPRIFQRTVSTLMTREVVVAAPGDDLEVVAHTMTERNFRHCPVVDEGRLVGILSIMDVIRAQRDQYRGELVTLQTQISGGDS